jgi:tRNA modification GTPase
VIVADTAGLRDGGDSIEAEGMRRARDWAERADLRVLILDSTNDDGFDAGQAGIQTNDLVLLNKIDRGKRRACEPGWIEMSVTRGDGMDQVVESLTAVARRMMDVGSQPVMTRERHRAALRDGIEALGRAAAGLSAGVGSELVAEDLRAATDALGRVTGRVDVEAILDIIFRDFCIGK